MSRIAIPLTEDRPSSELILTNEIMDVFERAHMWRSRDERFSTGRATIDLEDKDSGAQVEMITRELRRSLSAEQYERLVALFSRWDWDISFFLNSEGMIPVIRLMKPEEELFPLTVREIFKEHALWSDVETFTYTGRVEATGNDAATRKEMVKAALGDMLDDDELRALLAKLEQADWRLAFYVDCY